MGNGNAVTVTHCKTCGSTTNGQQYCSNACKQKAYRTNNGAGIERHQVQRVKLYNAPNEQTERKTLSNHERNIAILDMYFAMRRIYKSWEHHYPSYEVFSKLYRAASMRPECVKYNQLPTARLIKDLYEDWQRDDELILHAL